MILVQARGVHVPLQWADRLETIIRVRTIRLIVPEWMRENTEALLRESLDVLDVATVRFGFNNLMEMRVTYKASIEMLNFRDLEEISRFLKFDNNDAKIKLAVYNIDGESFYRFTA